ncbi:hypothetical protein JG687_00004515 [Phytophthora cactorum]|uniref:Uncharacterized protein n=1 Tax=Phytophthora cactorum TaxID=29920 RepID=A0A8T1UPR8_9STRA|nr:hypothetical protein JG687_00004515 [Phytophthora cactorum]
MDHSASIANDFEKVWPQITLLDCYALVSRKCRENSNRLRRKSFYDASVDVNIKQIHRVRSPVQFKAISTLCLEYWRKKKEGDCVDWFQEIYLDERWSKWYTTSAILSILLSQNAIESHNGDIKTAGITMKKAKTSTFLNASIPGVLALVAQDTSDKTLNTATRVRFAKEFVRRFCQIYSELFVPYAGPLPSKMVTKAHLHVEKGSYYELKRTVKRKASRSYLFHASKYMSNRSEPSAEPVTKQRADMLLLAFYLSCRYIRGKQGNLDKDDTVLDITTSYQALHEVEIFYAGGRTSNFQVKLEPTMPLKTTAAIRTIYQCDCKAFWGTSWVC